MFLSDGAVGDDVYYGEKADKSLGVVHSFHWKGDAMAGQWYYNGHKISVNDYTDYYYRFNQSNKRYSFANEASDRQIRDELSKTKKSLKIN